MAKNYYIQGDAANAQEIKAAFETKGINTEGYEFANHRKLYFNVDNRIYTIEYEVKHIVTGRHDYSQLELTVDPCFKEGDKIEATIYGIKRRVTIREVDKTNCCYFGTLEECIGFSEQGQWHLATKPHYDIANFKVGMPVLVRWYDTGRWRYSLYSFYEEDTINAFDTVKGSFTQCIPFEGNEHLLGTTDMPSEEYINW